MPDQFQDDYKDNIERPFMEAWQSRVSNADDWDYYESQVEEAKKGDE